MCIRTIPRNDVPGMVHRLAVKLNTNIWTPRVRVRTVGVARHDSHGIVWIVGIDVSGSTSAARSSDNPVFRYAFGTRKRFQRTCRAPCVFSRLGSVRVFCVPFSLFSLLVAGPSLAYPSSCLSEACANQNPGDDYGHMNRGVGVETIRDAVIETRQSDGSARDVRNSGHRHPAADGDAALAEDVFVRHRPFLPEFHLHPGTTG